MDATKQTADVKWFRSGAEITGLKKIHSKDLYFRNVREEDFGQYGCLLNPDSVARNNSRMYYVLLEKAGKENAFKGS